VSEAKAPSAGRRMQPGKPRATIYDIAKVAGVSPSTVSRTLSNPGRSNSETARKVRAAAEQLDYRANVMARALHTGRTGAIGLIVPDITNPVFASIVRGAGRAAATHGATLLLADTEESGDREVEASSRLLRAVDGLLLVSTRLEADVIRELSERTCVAVVNRDVEGIPSFFVNPVAGLTDAVGHLYELGHRSLAYVSGPSTSWMNRLRWETCLEAALQREMTIVEIGPNPPTRAAGAAAIRRVRAAGVSAALAFNDLMAIGLLDAAKAHNLLVPGDLSLVGFDDIFGSDFTSPTITTLAAPVGRMGESACHALIALIEGERAPAAPDIRASLVIRDSTGNPRRSQQR
jgi:LacI family transcriptional regulator